MSKTVKTAKAISKKTVVAPVKPFVVGQLAFHDLWDDGRGNSSTTTTLVRIYELIERADDHIFGTDAVVSPPSGDLVMVKVKNLRHLPDCFNGATI